MAGGAGAKVLPHLRAEVGRDGQEHARQFLPEEIANPLFVRRVDVRMEQADRHRLDGGLLHAARHLPDGLLIQGGEDLTGIVQALRHSVASVPRNHGLRFLAEDVVEPGPDLAGDLQDVPETLGGDQGGPGALPLDERIGRHGGPMDVVGDVRGGHPGFSQGAFHRVQESHRGIAGSAGHFHEPQLPGGLVHHDQVREGSADVDSDAIIFHVAERS